MLRGAVNLFVESRHQCLEHITQLDEFATRSQRARHISGSPN
jgi:hypothetical protein